jgi:tetratricopeptide (TPR) repeat protein
VTAIGLLRARLEEAETGEPLLPKSAARATSLVAMCEKGLWNEEDAARLFFEAFDLDPENTKHRANLVVSYLLRDDPESAEQCLNELLKSEPKSVMHWANWVYVKSAQGIIANITEIPEELRRTKDVCVAHVITLRANEDPRWYEEAKRALALHTTSRTLRRAVAEGELERAAALNIAGDASPEEISEANKMTHQAAEFLLRLWQEHTNSEIYPTTPDTTLLQNTIMGFG